MAELRGDFYAKPDDLKTLHAILTEVKTRLNEAGIALLFTIRSEFEGGEKLGFTEPTINDINLYVVNHGLSDMIDIEYNRDELNGDTVIEKAKEKNILTVISSHDFDKTPSEDEMIERYRAMQDRGADIIKLAVMPQSEADVDKLIDAVTKMRTNYLKEDTHIVGISMGELGKRTRIHSAEIGSYFTFATVGKASAPGQVSVEELY